MASGMKLVKRPRSPNYQFNEVRAEVKKELVPLAQEHVMARARVVDDWGNKVEFEYQIGIGPKQIYILIKLANPSQLLKSGKATIRNLWNWLDKTGTKAHRIPKSGVKLLKFEWGGPGSYVSKTGAGPARYGGPGEEVGGEMTGRWFVNHPGFPARHFSDDINRDLQPEFDRRVNTGYKRGLRKISSKK